LAEAQNLYQRALAIKRRLLGDRHPDLAVTLNNLALVELAQGHRPEAETMLAEALAIFEAALAADHPTVAACRGNLADIRTSSSATSQPSSDTACPALHSS
jgi:tetratricopeptide (TPR) repeat protein